MSKAQAPYRYDIVGSFLRKQELKKAREEYASGALSAEGLEAVEDSCIRSLVESEKRIGLKAVTDGEYRRTFWHLDFSGVLGCEESGS
ncbi:MAG: hypothetical protein V8S27_02890 [Lachnospiraceae bacterium]